MVVDMVIAEGEAMRSNRPGATNRFSLAGADTNEPTETIEDLEEELRKDLPEYEGAMDQYRLLLEESTARFAGMLEQANEDLKRSVGDARKAIEKELTDAREKAAADSQTAPKDAPESVWINDHLVMNKAAVDMIDNLLTQFKEILHDLAKQ